MKTKHRPGPPMTLGNCHTRRLYRRTRFPLEFLYSISETGRGAFSSWVHLYGKTIKSGGGRFQRSRRRSSRRDSPHA